MIKIAKNEKGEKENGLIIEISSCSDIERNSWEIKKFDQQLLYIGPYCSITERERFILTHFGNWYNDEIISAYFYILSLKYKNCLLQFFFLLKT